MISRKIQSNNNGEIYHATFLASKVPKKFFVITLLPSGISDFSTQNYFLI